MKKDTRRTGWADWLMLFAPDWVVIPLLALWWIALTCLSLAILGSAVWCVLAIERWLGILG